MGGEARGREESLEARSLKHRRPKLSLRVLSFLIRVASYYVILKKVAEVKDLYGNSVNRSTWSYENRVSNHFVIFLNFPCLIACLLCCLLMSFFFLACFVVRDLCRDRIRQNYFLIPPPQPLPYFFPYPQFFLLTQVTVIRNQRAPKAGFGAV